MAIPDEVYEDCASLTYEEGDWSAEYRGEGFDIYPGVQVTAFDDRVGEWVNAVIQAFERDKILVVWEDGFRFLFTASRAAIRPKAKRKSAPQEPQHDGLQQAFSEGYQLAVTDMMMSMATRIGALEKEVYGKK